MPRKPQVGYFVSRGAYYTKIAGVQHKLAAGPDDAPTGATYLAALGAFKTLLEKGTLDTNGDGNTVHAVFNAYLDACAGKKRFSTMELKRRMLKAFVERHGDLRVSQVKPYHAEQVITEMRRSRSTGNEKQRATGKQKTAWGDGATEVFLKHLKAAFNWAVRNELVSRNPLRNVETPHSRSRARERIVSPDEHTAVLALLRPARSQSLHRLIVALENTGARPGELTNATVQDFNAQLGAIVYFADDKRRTDEFAHKTSGKGKDRVIYFTGCALDMVKTLCQGKKSSDLIFPTNSGRRYTRQVLTACFLKIRERTHFKHYIPYAYRHSLATRWLEQGKPVEMLAQILGNTPATIHRHYSHLCRSHATLRNMLEDFRK